MQTIENDQVQSNKFLFTRPNVVDRFIFTPIILHISITQAVHLQQRVITPVSFCVTINTFVLFVQCKML